MPGPALIAIPLENGIEIHKAHISEKTVKNGACGAQVEAQIRQKLVKGVPSSPHRASKCSQMEPWAAKLVYFSDVLDDFRPLSLKIAPGMHFSLKTTLPDCLNRPAELLRLCIRSHCSPGLDRLGCFGLALGNHCSLGRCGYAFEITGRSAAMLQTLLRATSLAP